MKIPLRPLGRPKLNGSLAGSVAECCKVVQELRELDTASRRKLTAKAFLKSALRIAGSDLDRLRALREKIYSEGAAWFETKAFIRRAVVSIRSANWSGPSRELRRYNYMLVPETLVEIVALGSNTFEIFALAVLICTEKHADCFGECEDAVVHQKRFVDLALRRDDLYAQIQAIGPADWHVGPADKRGYALVTIKLDNKDTGVVLAPPENVAERLVGWALANANKPAPPPPATAPGGVRRVEAPV